MLKSATVSKDKPAPDRPLTPFERFVRAIASVTRKEVEDTKRKGANTHEDDDAKD